MALRVLGWMLLTLATLALILGGLMLLGSLLGLSLKPADGRPWGRLILGSASFVAIGWGLGTAGRALL
ncbi:MAG: hypothetical protein IGQ88_09175 [Gloeomargaritaceae cyanobacterium C42_A2020_066]|nr:hypothetical protein [Gloeomargaritaceae cyanobacterium C42_A2020_066]